MGKKMPLVPRSRPLGTQVLGRSLALPGRRKTHILTLLTQNKQSKSQEEGSTHRQEGKIEKEEEKEEKKTTLLGRKRERERRRARGRGRGGGGFAEANRGSTWLMEGGNC